MEYQRVTLGPVCKCGQKFGQHDLKAVIEPKDKCFTCGAGIDDSLASFNTRGNFCADCTRVAEVNARYRIKRPEPKTYQDYLKLTGIKFHGGE